MTLPPWRDWRTWGVILGIVGSLVGLIVALPKAAAVVEPIMPATRQFVRDANATQDASLLRTRIDIVRISLPQMRAARIQMDDLRAKNPDSDLLRLQVVQMDEDIAAADARLRNMTCELSKIITAGFAC